MIWIKGQKKISRSKESKKTFKNNKNNIYGGWVPKLAKPNDKGELEKNSDESLPTDDLKNQKPKPQTFKNGDENLIWKKNFPKRKLKTNLIGRKEEIFKRKRN